jgi:hypothetical protein
MMALVTPREWLGYSVELNDLPPLTVFFGPGVEPVRLLEILDLLRDAGVRFLQAGTQSSDRKRILIGAYNHNREPVTPFSPELARAIGRSDLTPDALTSLVRDAAHLRVVR